jgi:hypothetical protein
MNQKITSSGPFISVRRPISRRHFLRGSGVVLALPFLDAMLPGFVRAATQDSPLAPGAKPRRLFGICNNLGLLGDQFVPTGAGRDYQPSPYLALLQDYRNDFTVFSGVSHPNVDGGHPADVCFLSAAPHPSSSSFRNTLSLDQLIAEKVGIQTRFPSLTLAVNTRSRSLSCTSMGVGIPPEDKPSVVFKQLFLQGSAVEVEAQVRKLETGESILDAVASQLKGIQNEVSGRDRDRLDQYFTSVRDLEHRLQVSRGWEHKPKPVVKASIPVDIENPAQYFEKVKLMYGLARLAFETDSTRAISLMIDSVASPVVEVPKMALSDGYHNLSHHGKSEEKRKQLKELDAQHMRVLAGLYQDLKAVREGDETLLDRTMVLYGSNLGDANQHMCVNMPILFAGGGFKHGQHLAFDTNLNYPLTNLYVSILQRMGINQDKFVSSTGTMKGLEQT